MGRWRRKVAGLPSARRRVPGLGACYQHRSRLTLPGNDAFPDPPGGIAPGHAQRPLLDIRPAPCAGQPNGLRPSLLTVDGQDRMVPTCYMGVQGNG